MNEEIKLLNISDRIFKKYKRSVKGNKDIDINTTRCKLTRNFILGKEVCQDYDYKYITRRYGRLYIQVNMQTMEVVNIQNKRNIKMINNYINTREKQELNKLLGLE